MTTVTNILTGDTQTFSLPPQQAVIAAHAQSRKDLNTWGHYGDKYKSEQGKYGWVCGDFWAKK